jgi:MFS family permease
MSSNPRAGHDTDGFMTFIWSLGTQRDRRNKFAHIRWSIFLAASVLASALLLRAGLGSNVALKSAILALPIALLVPWLLAFSRFLREADELVRKIHMEGIAVGFLAGIAFGMGYVILQEAGLPQLHSSMAVAIVVAVMMLGYAVGRALASKRYR